MTASVFKFRTSASENGTVPPTRVKNEERRPREYLTEGEIEALMQVPKKRGRYGHRDATMMLVCYTHGLRVSELCSPRWNQVDFDLAVIHSGRCKKGIHSVQHMRAIGTEESGEPWLPHEACPTVGDATPAGGFPANTRSRGE